MTRTDVLKFLKAHPNVASDFLRMHPEIAFNALRDYVIWAGDAMVSDVYDGTDGQVAKLRFNEPTHPLLEEMEDFGTKTFKLVVIPCDDNAHPIDAAQRREVLIMQRAVGRWCKRFHILSREKDFQRFVYQHYGLTQLASFSDQPAERETFLKAWLHENILDSKSSKELDHNTRLLQHWQDSIEKPYAVWQRERAEKRANAIANKAP